ncbi:MAG: TatD family hydrolase [bacterium]
MKFIDSHAHVNFNAFKDDYREVIGRSMEGEVGVINVGSQYSTSKRAVDFANEFANVWAAIGVHPLHLQKQSFTHQDSEELPATEIITSGEDPVMADYFALGQNKKVVAIGEVGLDYHHFEDGDDIEKIKHKQKIVLNDFICLANELDLPIALHCWDAYTDLLEILKNNPVKRGGVVHSFIGSYKTARKFIELGFFIGLNGVITYSDSFDRLIKEVEVEHIILETDCPYLTPGGKRGTRNEPTGVIDVANHLARIKGISPEEVARQTTENSINLFRL